MSSPAAVDTACPPPPSSPSGPPRAAPLRRGPLRLPEGRWAAVATVLFAAAGLAQLADAPWWVWGVLYAGCYLAGGWEPAVEGVRALRHGSLDVDLLMVVAALGAAAIGQVFDGGLLIVIFATSGALEAWATARTEDSVRGLLALSPDRVTRRTGDGEELVLAAELAVGDLVVVRPGEDLGADGTVVEGASEVDQASVTGESVPAARGVGDEVFAGTRNGTGALVVRVTREPGDFVVARIAGLVEEASRTKARTQLFVERIEQRYSVGVVVATLAIFGIPLLAGAEIESALLRAMTFMIVASPCALVLATMPPLLAAVANAGRRGVLVRSAQVMEQLGSVDVVAFDKTGTLTRGTPELVAVRSLGDVPDACSEDEVLRLAAGAEHGSEHPLGRSVVAAARERGIPVPAAVDFTATPGVGVRAVVDGVPVGVGAPSRDGDAGGPVRRAVEELEAAGHTTLVVHRDGTAVGVLGLADRLRAGAADAVAAVVASGARPVLLTGDHERAAAAVASAVGITDVRAGLLPEDKVAAVEGLRERGRVLVVGDGVNDAPALAAADTGVAMGGAGADLTLHAAGAVIVRDEITALPGVVDLARRARRTVVANLVIAGGFIAVLVTWDLVGHLPLPLGVAGHEGSTILVALNGLRLLWAKPR